MKEKNQEGGPSQKLKETALRSREQSTWSFTTEGSCKIKVEKSVIFGF